MQVTQSWRSKEHVFPLSVPPHLLVSVQESVYFGIAEKAICVEVDPQVFANLPAKDWQPARSAANVSSAEGEAEACPRNKAKAMACGVFIFNIVLKL